MPSPMPEAAPPPSPIASRLKAQPAAGRKGGSRRAALDRTPADSYQQPTLAAGATMSRAPADLRRDYDRAVLLERDADADPVAQFDRWFQEAQGGGEVY